MNSINAMKLVVRHDLATIFDLFMQERQHCKYSTKLTYNDVWKVHIKPRFGALTVAEITPRDLFTYRSELACKYAGRTVNKIFQLLKGLLSFAVERELASNNPAALMRGVREEATDVAPFQQEELARVLSSISAHSRPYFETALWTGARPSELQALRWRDIDLQNGTMSIHLARVRGREGTTKTKSSKRVLQLLPPAIDVLRTQWEISGSDPHNYVFVTAKGDPITKHMDLMWRRACVRAGVEPRPPYQLRHTHASRMLAAGETPAYVARCLGHSTTETLYRHYARWIPDEHKDGRKILQALGIDSPSGQLPSPELGMHPVDRFLSECTERGASFRVEAPSLYAAYKSWCDATQVVPMNRNVFGRCMSARGFAARKSGRGSFKYLELRLSISCAGAK